MKKTFGDIIILHKCTKNHDHMLYCSWDMAHDRCNIFLFGLFFPFYPSISLKKQNEKKNEKRKTPGDIIIFHMCTKIYNQMMYGSWDMVINRRDKQMDGQMDWWKKWHREVGALPKNQWKYQWIYDV